MKIKREIDVLSRLKDIQFDFKCATDFCDREVRINHFKQGKIKLDALIELMEDEDLK